MKIDEMKALLREHQAQTERHMGALKEDFDHKLDVILEAVKNIPVIKETLDRTFEKVGEITVDIEVVKTAIQDHEQRVRAVEER